MKRTYEVSRKTKETNIELYINLDGNGEHEINIGIKFLEHMLKTLSYYSKFDLKIKAEGDLKHHLIEDIAIVLGTAFNNALKDKKGIRRFGYSIIPMDDSLVMTVVDISGRSYFYTNIEIKNIAIEDISDDLILHFLKTFAYNSKINLHIVSFYYRDLHHLYEAIFKSLGFSLREASSIVDENVPSLKGTI